MTEWADPADVAASTADDPDAGGGRHAGTGTAAVSTAGPIYQPRHESVDWDDLVPAVPAPAERHRAKVGRRGEPVRSTLTRMLGRHSSHRAARAGATGDDSVAREVAGLGEAWRVLHRVPLGPDGAAVDHVLIGPGGVFTVNAKQYPDSDVHVGGDAVIVDGVRSDDVRDSRHEAVRAARLLGAQARRPVRVTAVLAVVGARRGLTIEAQPRDGAVVVLGRNALVDYFRTLPIVLTAGEIEDLFDYARGSATRS
jgi:hypothetical protein